MRSLILSACEPDSEEFPLIPRDLKDKVLHALQRLGIACEPNPVVKHTVITLQDGGSVKIREVPAVDEESGETRELSMNRSSTVAAAQHFYAMRQMEEFKNTVMTCCSRY